MATWKEELATSSTQKIKYVPFHTSRRFFAVDCSGSTIGKIIKSEGEFVQRLSSNPEDKVVKWDNICTSPELVSGIHARSYWMGNGGTQPEVVLRHAMALREIRSSDAWILTTDGEISDYAVRNLTNLANSEHVMQIPIVLLVVGGKYSKSPDTTNISVAIPFYAGVADAIILFKDIADGRIYVVSAKGVFQPLSSASDDSTSTWDSLRSFANEEAFNKECAARDIRVVSSEDRQTLKGVSLGPEYESATGCIVNIDLLLQQYQLSPLDLKQLLHDETFDRLAMICKTGGKIDLLRSLLQKHKKQEVTVRLEDRNGAGRVMEKMQADGLTEQELTNLRDQLREAHALNRIAYQNLMASPSEEARETSEINRAINKALAYLTSLDKASYTADILSRKSNRAMRAERLDVAEAEVHLLALDISDGVEAFRSECSICAGDNEIMSIVLKKLDPATVEENTTNFALDFPLAAGRAARNVDMVSSQCICFQCALHCGNTIYREEPAAILPTVAYQEANKRYMNHQLCIAITNGLNTGMAGIAQLFMSILDRALETKSWCRVTEDTGEDGDISIRGKLISWMLDNIVTHCHTRETFNELGAWVPYPRALLWALDDFKDSSLDSWLIQYPVNGFIQFVRLVERIDDLEAWTTRGDLGLGKELGDQSTELTRGSAREKALSRLGAACEAKLIHLVITTMMKSLFQQGQQDGAWSHTYLELIYQGFNSPGVPRDLGSASILSAHKFWEKLLGVLGGWQDVKGFLNIIADRLPNSNDRTQRRIDLCRRVQLVIFWAAYTQKGHTSPKQFFHTIREREPLGPAVLDGLMASAAPMPLSPIKETLMSIFWSGSCDAIHSSDKIVPFASPFGPSVLHCAFAGCDVKFYDEGSGVPSDDRVRQMRAQHLKEVFGGPGFETSATGLPEPTQAPKRPSASHCNLHAAIARVWSTMPRKQENPIVESNPIVAQVAAHCLTKDDVYNGNDVAMERFVSDVRTHICSTSGRGDIYQPMENCIRENLPSFFAALKVASKRAGLIDESGLDYVYDWTQNKLAAKIEYEMSLMKD